MQNSICIVTGAAKGIGKAIAEKLIQNDAKVMLVDIDGSLLEKTCNNINNKKAQEVAFAYVCSIADIEKTRTLVEKIIKKFGKIDVLVNNAGIAQNVSIDEITPEQWDLVLNVNLRGTMFLSKYVFMEMKKKRVGRIINIASLAGERGGRFAGVHYSTSKAGVIMLTKCYALSGGDYGITCNAVSPGLIETGLSKELKFNTEEIPMKRFGSTGNVADAVAFLASEESSYITGMTLDVNGGIYMR